VGSKWNALESRLLKPSVILLTFNSEDSLPETLASVAGLTDDVHIIDSFSKDRTLEIAESFGVKVVQHPFENYGAQRNWAIDNASLRYAWQLHLDADERLTDELRLQIAALDEATPVNGYFVPRVMHFMGRTIRHGGMYPTWHARLFRNGLGRCESRRYDQHFYCEGAMAQLQGMMIDDIRMPLTEWTARHNRWADAEVSELLSCETGGRVQPNLRGNLVEKKRFLRKLYNDAPLFIRPFALFFYRYFIRLGFLDGMEGFIFFVLQTFWFRFLVDAKIYELRRQQRSLNP
jgi:glycosyltransferase involved in cell wall biosynthesis